MKNLAESGDFRPPRVGAADTSVDSSRSSARTGGLVSVIAEELLGCVLGTAVSGVEGGSGGAAPRSTHGAAPEDQPPISLAPASSSSYLSLHSLPDSSSLAPSTG